MPEDIKDFLAASPVFREVPPDQLEQIARLFRVERFPAGALVLKQGGFSPAVYFVRSGRLAVRVQRGDFRETIAFLQPPDMLGELSFVTGRPCSADVEVVVDAELLALPKEAVPQLPEHREALLRGLLRGVAERLHTTVTQGTQVDPSPVVLLREGAHWSAGLAFSSLLAESLGRQSGRATLLARVGDVDDVSPAPAGENAMLAGLRVAPGDTPRAAIARALTGWKSRFDYVLLQPSGAVAEAVREASREFADLHGYLLGPGDDLPAATNPADFVVQSASQPTLPVLTGRQQLIADEAGGAKFLRTVDSIARAIAGIQVGLALGGGAAWGWAHIGVLDVLEKGGIPIDTLAGCSMGSVIGGLHSAGIDIAGLTEIADYWRTRTRKFIQWRLWRLTLLNELIVHRTFHQYLGDRHVNQTEIPYWANAVDIRTGKEFTIRDGPLVDCVRASIALPGLLPPVHRDQHLLVDAGIMDPVPAQLVHAMGCQFNIAVNAMAALETQEVSTRYPLNALDVMTRCMFLMGHEIGEARAGQIANILFTPALGNITMLQFNRSPEIIECGRRAAEAHLPALQAGYRRLKQSRTAPTTTEPAHI